MANNKKENRNKLLAKIIFGIFTLLVISTVFDESASAQDFVYNSMEKIPGFESAYDADGAIGLPTLIETIYKFAMWVVGICALFMITIGGFTYMTSAGNTSTAATGKKMITDAIIGLILAFVAVLLFYTINPSLTTVNLQISPVSTTTSTTTGGTGVTATTAGTCSAATSGSCSTTELATTCFGSNNSKASGICMAESTGNPSILSGTDKCTVDGKSVSVGLFQINLTVHKLGTLDCPSAFDKAYTSSVHDCKVVNQNLYDQCVAEAKKPTVNIAKACEISNNGQTWSQWGANSQCKY